MTSARNASEKSFDTHDGVNLFSALQAIGLRKAIAPTRSLANRLAGTKRLVRFYTAALACEFVLVIVAMALMLA